jgi:hypothetical protein
MPQQPGLDVLDAQRLAQQRIVEQVDLADGEVVGGPPPGIEPTQFLFRQSVGFTRCGEVAGHGGLLEACGLYGNERLPCAGLQRTVVTAHGAPSTQLPR